MDRGFFAVSSARDGRGTGPGMAHSNGEGTPVQVRPVHDPHVSHFTISPLILISLSEVMVIFSSMALNLPPSERCVLFSRSVGPSLARSRVRPWRYSLRNSTPYQSPIEFSVLFKLQVSLFFRSSAVVDRFLCRQFWKNIKPGAVACLLVVPQILIRTRASSEQGGYFAVTSAQGWSAGRARDGPLERQNNPPASSLRLTRTTQSTNKEHHALYFNLLI